MNGSPVFELIKARLDVGHPIRRAADFEDVFMFHGILLRLDG
jgi:hypothetical protein